MTNSGLASYLKIYSSDGTPFLNHSIAFDSSSVALLGDTSERQCNWGFQAKGILWHYSVNVWSEIIITNTYVPGSVPSVFFFED